MAKGYVYIMTSAIDGLIKIGKSKDWNRRCKDELESNGYKNINALKTYYVAECEDYDEIESIMHDIFRESRVSNIEAFAVDKDRAKRVLSRMGTQVFPDIINNQKTSNTNKAQTNTVQMYQKMWTLYNNTIASIKSDIPVKTGGFDRSYDNRVIKNTNGLYYFISRTNDTINIGYYSRKSELFDKYKADVSIIESQINETLLVSINPTDGHLQIEFKTDFNTDDLESCIKVAVKKADKLYNVLVKQYTVDTED